MKKVNSKFRIFYLVVALSVLGIQQTEAHPWFGSDGGRLIAVQELPNFYGLCQYVTETKTYFFGFETSSELTFQYGACNMQ